MSKDKPGATEAPRNDPPGGAAASEPAVADILAELRQMRASMALLQAENKKLIGQNTETQRELRRLQDERDAAQEALRSITAPTAAPTAAPQQPGREPLRPGHVEVFTRYKFVVESWEGEVGKGKFVPQVVPEDTLIQVTQKELRIDQMRRFPHLETVADREARLAKDAEKKTAPVKETMDNVAAAFAAANEMVQARELNRQAVLKDVVAAQRAGATGLSE